MGLIKYGHEWKVDDDFKIEMQCIRNGGKWMEGDRECGAGFFHHYREMWKLLWPDQDNHRWSDLMLQSYCDHDITAITGCSDSSKTHTISKIVLSDYWCFPNDTLWLVSTTEGRGSELRVWGVIKDLFNAARVKRNWLKGNPVDYLRTITSGTIDKEKFSSRSLRRGIIVVPCFPSGTLVDTPSGKVKIENLKIGDFVFNAAGVGRIKETHTRPASRLVRVTLSDGRKIDCTPEHPFFTNRGWINAIDLERFDMVFSSYETMCILWGGLYSSSKGCESDLLLGGLPKFWCGKEMRSMSQKVQTVEKAGKQDSQGEILQHGLRGKVGRGEEVDQTHNFEMSELQEDFQELSFQSKVLFGPMSKPAKAKEMRRMRREFFINPGSSRKIKKSFLRKILQKEMEWSSCCSAERYSNTTRKNHLGFISRFCFKVSHSHGNKKGEQFQKVVSDRCGFSENKTGGGNRWWGSQDSDKDHNGQGADKISKKTWVDSLEILEPSSDERFDFSKGGYTVHNIEVEGHPSYSVTGVVVHNCKSGGLSSGLSSFIGIKAPRLRHAGDELSVMSDAFLNAYSNWVGKEDFKGLMTGNFMEMDDPLGIATEPEGGWDTFQDTGKTQSWKSRFYDANVIALDGRDSPNFDYPDHHERTHFPYLIGHKKLDLVAKTKGTNSWEWHSQCIGKPVKGMDIWRVFTKDFCIKHKAMEDVIWREDTIHLYALDPAYGGGDRCVGRHGELGYEIGGKQILYLHEPEIVPIQSGTPIEPEDQIALYIANRLKELKIPPQNCFYDSFGRGTLGYCFARLLGSSVPVPVDSSAYPTKRPVRFDMFVKNTDGSQRHKRCDEHYRKFITELWFSLREAIDAEQIRGMDLETIREGASRKFTRENNLIILESKEEMKKRTNGKSPDLCDCSSVLCEGARQLGFKIENIGEAVEKTKSNKPNWLEKEAEEYDQMLKSNRLVERV